METEEQAALDLSAQSFLAHERTLKLIGKLAQAFDLLTDRIEALERARQSFGGIKS